MILFDDHWSPRSDSVGEIGIAKMAVLGETDQGLLEGEAYASMAPDLDLHAVM